MDADHDEHHLEPIERGEGFPDTEKPTSHRVDFENDDESDSDDDDNDDDGIGGERTSCW